MYLHLTPTLERESARFPLAIAFALHLLIAGMVVWLNDPQLPSGVTHLPRRSEPVSEFNINSITFGPTPVPEPKDAAPRPRPKPAPKVPVQSAAPLVADTHPEEFAPTIPKDIELASTSDMWAAPAPEHLDSVVAAIAYAEMAKTPRFTTYSRAPILRNDAEVHKFLGQKFPVDLQLRGGEARAIIWLLIDASGQVVKALLRETSGRVEADSVALAVSHRMRFHPAEYAGQPVTVWVQQPIRFHVE